MHKTYFVTQQSTTFKVKKICFCKPVLYKIEFFLSNARRSGLLVLTIDYYAQGFKIKTHSSGGMSIASFVIISPRPGIFCSIIT